jgi:hypothetical protein
LSVLDAASADFPGHVPAGFDPAAEMRRLATQLAAAYEADPSNALLARELRMTLQSLRPAEVADTGLEELLRDLRA